MKGTQQKSLSLIISSFHASRPVNPISMQQDVLDHTDDSQKSGQKNGQESGQRLPQKTREILELLKKNPYITRKELSSLLHIAPSAIQKHIEKLKKGYIRRVGPG